MCAVAVSRPLFSQLFICCRHISAATNIYTCFSLYRKAPETQAVHLNELYILCHVRIFLYDHFSFFPDNVQSELHIK